MVLQNLIDRLKIRLEWRRAYRRIHAELDSYTQREMQADLGLSRSDIPGLASMAADQHVDRFVRPQLGLRQTWQGQDHHRLAHG